MNMSLINVTQVLFASVNKKTFSPPQILLHQHLQKCAFIIFYAI